MELIGYEEWFGVPVPDAEALGRWLDEQQRSRGLRAEAGYGNWPVEVLAHSYITVNGRHFGAWLYLHSRLFQGQDCLTWGMGALGLSEMQNPYVVEVRFLRSYGAQLCHAAGIDQATPWLHWPLEA